VIHQIRGKIHINQTRVSKSRCADSIMIDEIKNSKIPKIIDTIFIYFFLSKQRLDAHMKRGIIQSDIIPYFTYISIALISIHNTVFSSESP